MICIYDLGVLTHGRVVEALLAIGKLAALEAAGAPANALIIVLFKVGPRLWLDRRLQHFGGLLSVGRADGRPATIGSLPELVGIPLQGHVEVGPCLHVEEGSLVFAVAPQLVGEGLLLQRCVVDVDAVLASETLNLGLLHPLPDRRRFDFLEEGFALCILDLRSRDDSVKVRRLHLALGPLAAPLFQHIDVLLRLRRLVEVDRVNDVQDESLAL